MTRARLVLLSLPLLTVWASAQQRLPQSRMFPITAPIREAGTVDVTTGKWTRPHGATKVGTQVVYNNTCTWAGGGYYAGFDWCEENYDEGRIPSPSSPGAPNGAQATNTIVSVQVTYCTFVGPTAGVGGYDMDLAFWDNLGGDCVGGVPPTPPPVSSTATAYLPLAGLGLPGSTAAGFQACWIVTLDTSNAGIVLQSDGDGVYDGAGALDKFTWMQRQNATQPVSLTGQPDGFFIAGDPAVGTFGSCSYDIPCGGVGGDCGTGLDTFDGSWINVDGSPVGGGSPPLGCNNSVGLYGFGTNCYFFGGYPAAPFASYYIVLESDGRAGAVSYCTQSKPTSVAGCTALLTASDLTLAGSWDTTQIPRHASLGAGQTFGVYIYTDGVGIGPSTASISVAYGTLCLVGFKRSAPACNAAVAVTGGGICNTSVMSTPIGCNGGALGVAVGEDVNVQLWYRDPTPAVPANANFSNAIFYTVQ